MEQKIVYNYIDGNGNKCVIKKESLEYFPMKPAFSSSGFYNGGEHAKRRITPIQFDEIKSAINKGISDDKNHIKDRVKMSGMIIITEGNQEKKCILAPHSEHVIKIEKILSDLIKK